MKKIFLSLLVVLGFSFVTKATTPMLVRIVADGQSMLNETVVYFDSSATVAYNPLFDAPSLGVAPGYLNITSMFGGLAYQVKGLPALTQSVSIPLKVVTGTSGTYQIYLNDVQNLPVGSCLWLYDNQTGTSADLRNTSYSCTVSNSDTSTRFTLNIIISMLQQSVTSVAQPECNYAGAGKITAQGGGSGPWNYYWKDEQNNIIQTTLNVNGADSLAGLNKGFYSVDINTAGTCNNFSAQYFIQGTKISTARFLCDTIISEASALNITNTSSLAASYWWDFGDGMGSADSAPSYMYAGPGSYSVTLTAFGSVCNDTSYAAKTITVTGTTSAQNISPVNSIIISRDVLGYFVEVSNVTPSIVSIITSKISGQHTLSSQSENVSNARMYLDITAYHQQIMLISVTAGKEKLTKKIFVD